jgi:hypothetical protein
MRFAYKNTIASVLVAAILVPYVGYLIRGDMPFLKDPRGMAATGLILGLAAAALAGSAVFAAGLWHRITLAVGTVTLALGIATVWVETSETLLAAFMIGIAVTYTLAELVHVEEPAATHTGRGGSLVTHG